MVNGDNIMRTITVTQGIEPELMLSSYTLNVAASSISKNVTVTSNIGWTASCDACWLTISPATGTNNGTLKITTAVNTTNSARTAFVMISGNGITCMIIVTQAATPTANAIVDAASVTYANNVLTVNTPQTEQVNVYAMSGVWVYGARKNTGTTTFDLSRLPDGVYIVTGESGWRKKVIKN
jgi:hypothetical protein